MAKNVYVPGDYKVVCDRCGFEMRNSHLITEWTGLRVCRFCVDKKPTYPTGPADKAGVPIPRPENDGLAYGYTNQNNEYGINLFPDPFIDPANDGLWTSGTDSQKHVYAEYFSKKLNSEAAQIVATGLTIGQVYRFKVYLWTFDTVRVLIDGEDTGLFFENTTLEQWANDSVFFTAISESITVSFENTKATDAWFDNIYIQEYNVTESFLTPAEQIANKKPRVTSTDLSAQPNLYDFFTFDEDGDFNSTGFDDGLFVDTLE